MSPRALLNKYTEWFDIRPKAEKVILAVLGFGGLIYLFTVSLHDPSQAQIASLERQLATVERRVVEQQTRSEELRSTGVEDPDSFIRQRLEELIQEQTMIQGNIESLAGNLVSPNGMTQMLTGVLDSQEGLTLIKVENIAPRALTNPTAPLQAIETNARTPMQSIGFQVFQHGLILEFQGNYFSTLRYLLYLESMDESFFWDGFEFEQTVWPEARVRLELHTLSSEEGFIGV